MSYLKGIEARGITRKVGPSDNEGGGVLVALSSLNNFFYLNGGLKIKSLDGRARNCCNFALGERRYLTLWIWYMAERAPGGC